VAEDTALVIELCSEPAANAFGLFDHSIEAFGACVADVVGEGDQNCRPPGLHGPGEPGGLGQLRVDHSLVEVSQSASDLGRFSLFEQQPEPFFDRPRGLDFLGGSQMSKDRHMPPTWPSPKHCGVH
jgi:hypothetical protein